MAYIKIKKIWLKKLDEKFVEHVFNLLKELSPVLEKDWENLNFTGAVAKYGQFVHPETDKYDDSEGIQPKEIQKLKKYLGDDFDIFFRNLIPAFNIAAQKGYLNNFISDSFISWTQVFQSKVFPILESDAYEKASLGEKVGIIISTTYPTFSRFNNIERDVLIKIGEGYFTEQTLEDAISTGLLPKNERNLRMEYINLETYFEERRKIWFLIHKIKPQSEFMLRVNPNNFDKEILNVVNDAFGIRQIGKLSLENANWVSLLIDNFGKNVLAFPIDLIKSAKFSSQLSYGNDTCKDFSKVIEKLIKANATISFSHLKLILNALHKYDMFEEFILKQTVILQKDIDVIYFISNIVNQINNDNVLNTLQAIDPIYFRTFFRYRVQSSNHIIALMNLLNTVGKKRTSIPLISGKVGNYTYEVIEKDNPIGLILGYATDCCQVIGGEGEACLRAGYQKKDSTFFVVRKQDTIYAQSWMWSKDKTKKGTGVCFDSIEVLGKDLNKSKDILNCYLEAAKELSKKYDVVYAGADGNRMPTGLEKIGKHYDIDDVYDLKMDCPWVDIYSDLTGNPGGMTILNERKIKNGEK